MTRPFEPSIISRLEKIKTAFEEGMLGNTSHEEHPGLPKHSRENYLYFTLAPALNFQRRSEQLWHAAATTYSDVATSFVFEPYLVCETSDTDLRAALTEHALATRPIRHTDTWRRLCGTLVSRYRADPRVFLEACEWDVPKVLGEIEVNKRLFPMIAGPKMSHYWLFILSRFTDAKFKNIQAISIIPDIHVRRATVYLGITDDAAVSPAERLASIWQLGLEGSGISPSQLHGPLWLWSRAGFPEL